MNKISLILLALMLSFMAVSLHAAGSNPLDDMLTNDKTEEEKSNESSEQEVLSNDIIMVNYAKKNAKLAMLMSAVFPGAGQFYADKSSFTTYLFPVIEAAVIGGILYYNNQGDKKRKEYKNYVTETITLEQGDYVYTGPRYNRDFQIAVQDTLISIHSADIYDGLFFSLDPNDSQHFFEDIGKYNKYIFGWTDWYLEFAESNPDLDILNPTPQFNFLINDPNSQLYNSPENTWASTTSLDGTITQEIPYSGLREEYIKMRREAEDKYRTANNLSFGIALNHIISAIDAVRITRKVNRLYLSENDFKFNYYAYVRNGNITPMVGFNLSF